MNELDLYGPPGTGKTTRLTRLAIGAVNDMGGADSLGAVTYTRTAATELKGRIAGAMSIPVPSDPRIARNLLDRVVPNVGTIHSLCYRLIGRPKTVTGADLNAFAHSVDPRSKADFKGIPSDPGELEGFEYADVAALDEIELALKLHAAARHRMIPLEDAWPLVPDRNALDTTPERLASIVKKYEAFKTEVNKIDFEDMLEWGREQRLPVRVLLCDEVQDNSALLWSVIDAWSQDVKLLVCAGDPWQAIYLFSGAAPELFRGRQGKWLTIGNSRRLSMRSAEYALDLLRSAGYSEDALLSTWTGEGGLGSGDGSTFYLARTNSLLKSIKTDLEWAGTPYRLLRGIGPLQLKAAKAYMAAMRDREDTGYMRNSTAHAIAEQLGPNSLPRGWKAEFERASSDDPDGAIEDDRRAHMEGQIGKLPYASYYQRVHNMHGMAGMVLPAPTQVGTIHGAKGREADEVYLARSWGFLPGRALSEGHEREEACVAYVGVTRHRTKLSFIDGLEGLNYPFARLSREG